MMYSQSSHVPPVSRHLSDTATLDRVVDMVRASSRITVFTGAGISTESGIPDYRGPNGVWARQAVPHVDTMRTDREARLRQWQDRRRRYPEMMAKQPNAGHDAIARLERSGKLLAIVTQNIDGLHQKAGNSPDRIIELHGSTHRVRCTNCSRTFASIDIHARLEAGEDDPRCPVCGGTLRGGTILFGEALPEDALRTAVAVARATDLMIVVGSSLVVNPAARIPMIAKEAGARLVILNRTETPLDDEADVRIAAEAGPSLTYVADQALHAE